MNKPPSIESLAPVFAEAFPGKTFGDPVTLAGDASARSYYRVIVEDGLIVVVMSAPEAGAVDYFAGMTGLMNELGVQTPEIFGKGGPFMILENLGDTLLQDLANSMAPDMIIAEYYKQIDALLDFQGRAMKRADKSHNCFGLFFDGEKLGYETGYANRHYIQGYLGSGIGQADLERLDAQWQKINQTLESEAKVLAHRDFHSRNIMCPGQRRVWIDYQDARVGAMQYDLCSLLLDPYADLEDDVEEELLDYYLDNLKGATGQTVERERFIEIYRLSGAQRLYKALGTYGYQASELGVKVYVRYMPVAVRKLKRILDSDKSLKPLNDILGPLF